MMLERMTTIGIRTKIMMVPLTIIVICLAGISLLYLPYMEQRIIDERKMDLTNRIGIVVSLMAEYNARSKQGEFDLTEAKHRAKERIKAMSFGQKEYFWITDDTLPFPFVVMHPTIPALDGRRTEDEKYNCATEVQAGLDGRTIATDGHKNLFQAFAEVVRAKGEGFVRYQWPKPLLDGSVSKALYPKLSFVKRYQPWGWIIGTGMYVDDVNDEIAAIQRATWSYALLFSLLSLIVSWFLVNLVLRPLRLAAKIAAQLSSGRIPITPLITPHDEAGRLLLSIMNSATEINAARIERERFRRLIMGTQDAIYVADAKTGRILDATTAGWTSLGYTEEELLKMSVWDIERAMPSLEEWHSHVALLRDGKDNIKQGVFVRKDGTRFPTEVRVSLVADADNEYLVSLARDVTERQRFEADLIELEEKSRLILSSVKDGIIGVDSENKTIFANCAASMLLGYTEEELLTRPLHDLVHHTRSDGSPYPRERCAVCQTAQSGVPAAVRDDVLWRKDGTAVPVSYTTTPMRRDNALVGAVLVFRDITFEKLAEVKISSLEAQSRLILSSVQDGIIHVNEDGLITLANPAALAMLGYAEGELLDLPMHDTLHYAYLDGSNYPVAACPMHQARLGGHPRVDSEVLWRRDGQPLAVEYFVTPLDQGGGVYGTVITFRDITERKRAEKALKRANEQLSAIFDAATIAICLLRGRTFDRYNKRFCEMFGYDQEELLGQTTRCLHVNQEQYLDVGLAYPRLLKGEMYQRGVELQRKDGTRLFCQLRGRLVLPGDPLQGSVWSLADVTKEQETIESLQKAKELAEDAARLKAEFLANMSHEIRTPMNAIIGMSYLALKTEINPRQQNYLKKIHASGQHLLGIINDILDISKIEAGRFRIDHVEFSLEEVFNHTSHLTIEGAATKGIEFIVDIDPAIPDYLIGDPLRVGQILINYTSNAVKFTEKGEIVLRATLQVITDDEVSIRFSVRDTGIGLTEEQQGQLFQSFTQVDQSSTRRFGGTGLGLALSKRLAGLMGGEVGIESVFGQGSTFWFTAKFGRVVDRASHRLVAPDLHGRRILVVDDNEYARLVLTEMLRHMGFTVDAVDSGQSAIERIAEFAHHQNPYDVVTLDWQMPAMDGIETANRILALDLRDMPRLIMVTSYGSSDISDRGDGHGIEAVLVKPVNHSSLLDTITRVLGNSQQDEAGLSGMPSAQLIAAVTTRKGARILLVEDNEFNQELAIALLTDVGFVVDLATNGALAVEQVQRADYDLVLMDMQMPVMDGIEATLAIRRQFPRLQELPIIAMTANVMQQERDQCEAAGMVDHIAKPIDPDRLWRVLLQWIKPRENADTETKQISRVVLPFPKIAGLDTRAGLRRVMNNHALYRSMLRLFLENHRTAVEAIAAAIENNQWEVVDRYVHTLKGVAGSIGAIALQNAASRLEVLLKGRESRTLEAQLAVVSGCLAPLIADLELKLLEAPAAAAITSVDSAQLWEVCAKLAEQLSHDDFDAHKTLEANEELLKATFGEDFYTIEESIRDFNFENALLVLNQVAETLKIFKQRKVRH